MKLKRPIIAVCVLIIGLSVVISGALAWQTSEDHKRNDFQIAGLRAEIDEEFSSPAVVEPDDEIEKTVHVKNTGNSPAFIRVMALPVVRTLSSGEDDITLPPDVIELDIDTANWIDGGDGYYYYKKLVDPGTATEVPLFTKVTVMNSTGYNDAKIDIVVKSEACGVTKDYGYRVSFWGSTPSSGPLHTVDALFVTITDDHFTP